MVHEKNAMSLVIWEVKIKTTRYHFTPVSMVAYKLLVEMQHGAATMERSMKVSQKIKN